MPTNYATINDSHTRTITVDLYGGDSLHLNYGGSLPARDLFQNLAILLRDYPLEQVNKLLLTAKDMGL